jgi:hypothetical protein
MRSVASPLASIIPYLQFFIGTKSAEEFYDRASSTIERVRNMISYEHNLPADFAKDVYSDRR